MELLRRIMREEAGQALPMALLLLLLGAILIIPTLSLTTTNLNATRAVDQHTRELYAADAGVENALWYLQSDQRVEIINPLHQWPIEYRLSDYQTDETVNNKNVTVNIDTAWLLDGLTPTLPTVPPAADTDWTLIGAIDIDHNQTYIIDISTDLTNPPQLNHIGVWLPQGYSYKAGTVKINNVGIGGAGDAQHLVKAPDSQILYRGGTAYIWSYPGTTFKSLSDIAPTPTGGGGQPPASKFPASVRLSFDYDVAPFKEARGFFPWMQLADYNIAWDSAAGFYHVRSTSITSDTDNTTVEAYVPKGVKRYVSGASGASSAIQGDYIAIGNSLMTCCWNQAKNGPPTTGQSCYTSNCSTCCTDNPYRNYAPAPTLFTGPSYDPDAERESSATVNSSGLAPDVPSDAKIERVYLYYTAWLRGDTLWTERGQTPSWSSTWTSYMGDDTYWEAHAPQSVKDWLKLNAYDGKAYLAVNDVKVTPKNAGDTDGTVVADKWYISEGSNNVQPSYQYSCFADVTAQIKAVTDVLPGTKFTVAGVHAHADSSCLSASPTMDWNRSSNAGWSMVIIYSSAQKETHQIYLYEGCSHLYNATKEFTITGFAAPLAKDLEGGTNEAKMTVFASEGDITEAEYLGFKGQHVPYQQLWDITATPGTYTKGVFNSISSAPGFTASTISTCQAPGEISGIDIDTYTATKPTGGTALSTYVAEGDISANIKAQSTGDGFEVIYLVFSVRSTATPAGQEFNVGSMLYRIE